MSNRSDDFNRANNASAIGNPSDGGGAYSLYGDSGVAWQIFNNAAFAGTIGNVGIAVLETSATDGTLICTKNKSGSGGTGGAYWSMALRFDGTSQMVMVNCSTTTINAYTWNGSALTEIGSGTSYTGADNDVFKVTISGNNYEVFQNNVSRKTFTTSHCSTSTKHGIGTIFVGASVSWDDLSWTDAAAAGKAAPFRRRSTRFFPSRY